MDGTCKEAEFQTGFDKLAQTITTNDAEIRNGLGQLADSIVWMPLYLCLCYIVALAVVFVAICAIVCLWCYLYYENSTLTLSCSANERTEMKLKIYLSEAWMCSEFGYQRPMSNKKGLRKSLCEGKY